MLPDAPHRKAIVLSRLSEVEAIGTVKKSVWQYAFVRATSGGLKLGNRVVLAAEKYPAQRIPHLPHFTMQQALEK